jgi:hypothetical protein
VEQHNRLQCTSIHERALPHGAIHSSCRKTCMYCSLSQNGSGLTALSVAVHGTALSVLPLGAVQAVGCDPTAPMQ